MKFLIIDREDDASEFRDVACVEKFEDAVAIVHALLSDHRRNLQLWGTFKGRSAWHVKTHHAVWGTEVRALPLSECLANAQASEKKWKASQKLQKARVAFWRDHYPLICAAGYTEQSQERKDPIYRAVGRNEFDEAVAMLEAMKAERAVPA